MSLDSINNEKELLTRIAQADEAAMKELFTRYYSSLVFFAKQLLNSKEDAEDVVVQVFTKLWINCEQLLKVQQIKPFLYSAVKNATIDLMRQQKKLRTQELPDNLFNDKADDTANVEATKAEVLSIIHVQINALPDKCRQVFLLSYIEGLTTQQVADQLGISVSNVTSQRSRAIQLLRKSMLDKHVWALVLLISPHFK